MVRSRCPSAEHNIPANAVRVAPRCSIRNAPRSDVEVRPNLIGVPRDDHIARTGVTRGSRTLLGDERIEPQCGRRLLAHRLARRRWPSAARSWSGTLTPRAATQDRQGYQELADRGPLPAG